LGSRGRLGRNRLSHKRPILREGPLQDRWNPLSNPQHRRRVERAFGHLIQLELILARFHRHSSRKLCSRMDLEKVLLIHSAAEGSHNFTMSDNGHADDEEDLALIFLCPRAFEGTHSPSLVRL